MDLCHSFPSFSVCVRELAVKMRWIASFRLGLLQICANGLRRFSYLVSKSLAFVCWKSFAYGIYFYGEIRGLFVDLYFSSRSNQHTGDFKLRLLVSRFRYQSFPISVFRPRVSATTDLPDIPLAAFWGRRSWSC